MSRPLTLALLVAFPGIAVAAPATAPGAKPKPATPSAHTSLVNAAREAWLGIGGVGIVKLADKSVCASVRDRNERITVRLVNALEKMHRRNRFRDPVITIEPPYDEPWIVIEGVPVMKVTYQDVLASRRDAQSLAREYAEAFRRALRRIYTP
ncbi:MAG: hypothetical protein QHJ73_06265 [Armatimonadota bacterium]|nr:hypothetical protein [Armatimonadota bacterium]